ncbi:MAG TPA: cupin domain-containing protein [Thermoleophilia bacterium]|nr:cupin domain-containing protein [Thermoleophilia bacterium]
MARENILQAAFTYEPDDPDGYRAGMRRFGPEIGASMLGGSVYEVPPGQSICPYHYEYGNEEWLLVLDGAPVLRTPAGEETLAPGEVVCFRPGPDGAHKVTNRGDETLHVLMLSTMIDPAVTVYPDSDKIGVWPGDRRDNLMVRRRDGAVDYFDGE